MEDQIKTLISNIKHLAKQNPNKYIEIVSDDWQLPKGIEEIFAGLKFNLHVAKNLPRAWVVIDFKQFLQGEFAISYKYHLEFSKFGKFYKEYFTYTILNQDPDRVIPSFFGEEVQPLTKQQEILKQKVDVLLDKAGYYRLTFSDQIEVICGLEFSQDSMKFFGPQPTVEMLLFKDFFGLGPNP